MNTPPPLPPTVQTESANRRPKWFIIYAIGSSVLILVLLCVLILRRSDSARESLSDARQRSAEYAKQDQAFAKEAKRRAAIARIEGLESQLGVLRQSLAATEAEKADYTTKISAYMMDHKLAIAALGITIAGAGVAMDDTNKYNSDDKFVAGVSAFVAGAYALSNSEECAEVANQIAKAKTVQSDYDNRIARTRWELVSLQSQIDERQAELQ